MIEKDCNAFVLKPQDEGGAKNFYGEDIIQIFKRETYETLKSYILMQKIMSITDYTFVL